MAARWIAVRQEMVGERRRARRAGGCGGVAPERGEPARVRDGDRLVDSELAAVAAVGAREEALLVARARGHRMLAEIDRLAGAHRASGDEMLILLHEALGAGRPRGTRFCPLLHGARLVHADHVGRHGRPARAAAAGGEHDALGARAARRPVARRSGVAAGPRIDASRVPRPSTVARPAVARSTVHAGTGVGATVSGMGVAATDSEEEGECECAKARHAPGR